MTKQPKPAPSECGTTAGCGRASATLTVNFAFNREYLLAQGRRKASKCASGAGLATPALHIARVRTRVARGGHDIPEPTIRRRFEHSRLNLIELMPVLTALRVYDNSAPADPAAGKTPAPRLVLHLTRGRIVNPRDMPHAPEWAKPIVAAAMKLNSKI